MVEERAAKKQKTLLSPTTEPAQPANGRFKVWHSPAVAELGERIAAVEQTFLPLLRQEFCLAQRVAANVVLAEEGIQCQLPTSIKQQRMSMTERDIRLLTGGDAASASRPLALDRVKDVFACARC